MSSCTRDAQCSGSTAMQGRRQPQVQQWGCCRRARLPARPTGHPNACAQQHRAAADTKLAAQPGMALPRRHQPGGTHVRQAQAHGRLGWEHGRQAHRVVAAVGKVRHGLTQVQGVQRAQGGLEPRVAARVAGRPLLRQQLQPQRGAQVVACAAAAPQRAAGWSCRLTSCMQAARSRAQRAWQGGPGCSRQKRTQGLPGVRCCACICRPVEQPRAPAA